MSAHSQLRFGSLFVMLLVSHAPRTIVAQAVLPAPAPTVTLPAEFDRVLRDYERGWRAGKPDSVAQLFTADGYALPNGKAPAHGRAAIAATYAGPGGDLRLRALSYAASDSVGYIIGAYRYGAGEGDMGKFVLALRKQGGRWMIGADMDNSSAPRRPPSSPSSSSPQ